MTAAADETPTGLSGAELLTGSESGREILLILIPPLSNTNPGSSRFHLIQSSSKAMNLRVPPRCT